MGTDLIDTPQHDDLQPFDVIGRTETGQVWCCMMTFTLHTLRIQRQAMLPSSSRKFPTEFAETPHRSAGGQGESAIAPLGEPLT